MVSLLWKACSEGDLQKVQELLEEPNGVDIELKDYTGVTPLIEAVKNGHVEIVKLLLDKGADPTNASKDGRAEVYTSEPAILDLLQVAVSKTTSVPVPPPQSPYLHDTSDGTDKHFYPPPPPPPDAYIYYPPMNPNMNEGGAYYLPPGGPVSPNTGIGHLPPPEIARMIPCRYFPACRYGSQCMFLHPQGPYYQGAMPYPPYDPMANPYGHYYPAPPPPFQQPLSAHSVPPMTPPPNSALHNRSSSEVVSPVQPFSPNGSVPPPPSNYGPPIYPPPGQLPMQYQIPPPRPHPGHHSPPNLYDAPPIVTPYPLQPDVPYPSQGPPPNGHYPDPLVRNVGETTPAENPTQPNGVNGINHHRRGSMRHPSFGSRKPPCLFFPSGRCKNGDDCRFPHILSDVPTQPNLSQGKGGPPRPPRDGQGSLADKLSNLNLRDDQRPTGGIEGSGRPYTSENGHRQKFQANGKHHYQSGLNGHAKKGQPVKQQIQRVPNADEFPVLAGSVTPPKLVNGNGVIGPTAAQVLQAPPPARKDASKESSTRDTTPEPGPSKELKPEANGHQEEKVVLPDQHVPSYRLPIMSFAAAAAASSVVSPDTVQEISVSA